MASKKNYYKPKFIKMICENPDCKKEFEINIKTYKWRCEHNIPYICPNCMKIYKSESHSKGNIKRFSKPEERKKQSRSITKYWNNLSPEGHKERGNDVKRGQSNMTQEAKEKQRLGNSRSHKESFINKSLEDKQKQVDTLQNGNKNWLNNLTNDGWNNYKRNLSNGVKKYYKNLSLDDRILRDFKIRLNFNKDNIMIDKYFIDNGIDMITNNPEKQFIEILLNNNIRFIYQWNSLQIHPLFNEMIQKSPNKLYNYASPYHRWDFLIHHKLGNIFVDIDGSIHNIKQEYGTKTAVTFNDSKRIYQTDGYPAVIIECHNDNLILDSKIIYLKNGNVGRLESFINTLNVINRSIKKDSWEG